MIRPLTNDEKIQKYTAIIANNTNWTSGQVNVGDVIIPTVATLATPGTAVKGSYVAPASASTSATTALLGVVVAVRQLNGQQELSAVTSAVTGATNTTSSVPYVVDYIKCSEPIDWIADVGTSSGTTITAVAVTLDVASYIISPSTNTQISGLLTQASTLATTSVFNSTKAVADSSGALTKVIGRFQQAATI